jgi:hypothetical protein
MTRLPRVPLLDRTTQFFYTTLPYIGVRSWVAYARFEVRNGKLDRSQTGVEELRMESPDSSGYRHFVPLGYEVWTRREAASFELGCNSSQDYGVYVSHGYPKFPANMLTTCVVQSAGTPTKRAFDVNLRCLNSLFAVVGSTNSPPRHGLTIPRRAAARALVVRTNNPDLSGLDG